MKTKKKKENTYKFQTFAQRISNINIGVLTQTGDKFHGVPDNEKDTFFRETLAQLSETNCSLDFISLYRELKPLVGSFYQLVYHKVQIVTLLKKYLILTGSFATKACLQLVESLARDLAQDFYPVFHDLFEVLISLLKQKDAELHEDTFHCIGYVFKCTWRWLVKEIDPIFKDFKSLLIDSQDHIQLFAAEIFAFLIQKSKTKKIAIKNLFHEISMEPNLSVGVGCVLFHVVKGIKYQFVFAAEEILDLCLQLFLVPDVDSNQLFTALGITWNFSLKHAKPEHSQLLFNCLYKYIEDTSVKVPCLHFYFNLLNLAVSYKSGYYVNDQDRLFNMIKAQFSSPLLHHEDVSRLIVLTKSSTKISKLKISEDLLSEVFQSIMDCGKLTRIEKLDFCRSMFNWVNFEGVLKPVIMKFLSQQILIDIKSNDSSPQGRNFWLDFVAELIYKDEKFDGPFSIHLPDSAFLQFDMPNDDLAKFQDWVLDKIDVELWQTDDQLLWTLAACLCQCKFHNTEKVTKMIVEVLNQGFVLCKGSVVSKDKLCCMSHYIRFHLILSKEKNHVKEALPWQDMVEMVTKYPANEHVLQAFEAYCGFLGEELHQFSSVASDNLYSVLKTNLSSPHKLQCLLTLMIFQHFEVPREAESIVMEHGIFQCCIETLNTEANVHTYQEKLKSLRLIVWREDMSSLHRDIALRFTISNLFVNFSLMWDPVGDMIATFADERNDLFWDLWLEILNSTSDLASGHVTEADESTGYYGAFYSSLTMTQNTGRVDYNNFRILLWKTMTKFSDLVEKKAKDVVPLYFQFMQNEYSLIDEMVAKQQDLSSKPVEEFIKTDKKTIKKGKAEFQALCAYLQVFSLFKKPRKLENEFNLLKCYQDFLTSKDNEIQSLALSCLMTFQHPYMTPYKENFDNLMTDSKFRDELLHFSLLHEDEDPVIKPDHLKSLMPVLIRLLYGKLQRRSGLGASGKTSTSARHNIIMQFLINCPDEDVKPFFEIILEPFQGFEGTLLKDISVDITSVIPLRKQLGFLKMFSKLLQKLRTKVDYYMPQLFDTLLKVLYTNSKTLEFSNLHASYTTRLKGIRQQGLTLLNELFEKNMKTDYQNHITDLFHAAVWPQISSIVSDSVQNLTPLLKLFVTWSKNKESQHLLRFQDETGRSPIECVFKLLEQKALSSVVEASVMNIALVLLQSEGNGNEENGATTTEGLQIMQPYITGLLNYISEKIIKKTSNNSSGGKRRKQMMKNVIPNLQFSVLSHLSKLVSSMEQSSLIVSILFPLLQCIASENTQTHIITTINNLLPNLDDSSSYLDIVPSLFSSVQARIPRQILCKVYLEMTKNDENFSSIGELVNNLNAWDTKHLEEPDYDKRLSGFRTITESVKAGIWNVQQFLPVIHNVLHILLTTDDLSLRNAASSSIEAIISLVETKFDELFSVLILRTVFPCVKSGVKSKKDDVRFEFISLLGLLVKTFQHEVFSNMACLCSEDPETDFFKNFNHIQAHRKTRAVRQLATCCEQGMISVSNMFFIFIPMITPLVFTKSANKEHNLVTETISALGSIMKHLPWAKYLVILKKYLKLLRTDFRNQKNTLRIVMAILDNFHFDLSLLEEAKIGEEKGKVPKTSGDDKKQEGEKVHIDQISGLENKTLKSDKEEIESKTIDFQITEKISELNDAEDTLVADIVDEKEIGEEASEENEAGYVDFSEHEIDKEIVTKNEGNEEEMDEEDLDHKEDVVKDNEDIDAENDKEEIEDEDADNEDEDADNEDEDEENDKEAKEEENEDEHVENEKEAKEEVNEEVNEDECEEDIELEADEEELETDDSSSNLISLKRIYTVLTKNIIPDLNHFLKKKGTYDSSKLNYKEIDKQELLKLPMEFALSQLLQKLPGTVLHAHLAGVLLRVSASLKSHSKDVRDGARDILKKISSSLGAPYLPMVLKEMRSILVKGYQLHVLGYSLYSILENMSDVMKSGDVDGIISEVMDIVVDELVGVVAEEKDVSAITSKLHEAKHCRSNATSEIVAKFVSNSVIGKVLTPIIAVLDSTQNHTNIHKMEELLFHVASGLQVNLSLSDSDLLIYIHGVLSDAMTVTQDKSVALDGDHTEGRSDSYIVPLEPARGGVAPKTSHKTNNYILVTFGLHILSNSLKRQRLVESNTSHIQMLDPLFPLVLRNLSSSHNKIITLSLKCLSFLFRFELPTIKQHYLSLGKNIFKIMKTYTQAGATKGKDVDLIGNAFKVMTILVKDHKDFNITDKQFKILLSLIEEDIHIASRQIVALPLLKSILSRKVKITLISDIIVKVCDLSVRDVNVPVQLQCRKIILQYLLDYPLGKKIVDHFDFYLTHLSYEEEPGRLSALEMLSLIINNIPDKILIEFAGYMFLPMILMLVNDDSAPCRKMCGCTVKALLQKLPLNVKDDLFGIITKFYTNPNKAMQHVAIQLTGLFAEVEGKGFSRRLDATLSVFKEVLQSCCNLDDDEEEDKALDKSLYMTLNCLVKIFGNNEILKSKDGYVDRLGEMCDLSKAHLLHPHSWIRLAASQLTSLYLACFTPETWVSKNENSEEESEKDSYENIKELCFLFFSQIKDENMTKELGNQATKNLIFLFRVVRLIDPCTNNIVNEDLVDSKAESDTQTETNIDDSTNDTKFTVKTFIKKCSKLAAYEAANNPKESKKRLCVLRLVASVGLALSKEYIKNYLPELLTPVHREIKLSNEEDSDLHSLAQEVLELLQGIVDKETFAEVYAKLQKTNLDRKDAKKRKLLSEAVTNPSKFALKKQKKNLGKKEQRKRKMNERNPYKQLKKIKRTNDT